MLAPVLVLVGISGRAQPGSTLLKWSLEGNAYYKVNAGSIVRVDLPDNRETVVVTAELLRSAGEGRALAIRDFAFSADGKKVYVEDLAIGVVRCLTSTEGTPKLINGTFDWAYEEELECRDGFRWSPDGQHIAYWQIDANKVKDYLMLNTTDSTYPFVVPVEYPVAGEAPSSYRIGVVDIVSGSNRWMDTR